MKNKPQIDSQSLAKAISGGDENAFREFYLDYLDSIVAFLTRIFHSEEEARDVAQDTFAMLWENRANFAPHTSVKGYVAVIARNLAFKTLREKSREVSIEDVRLWQEQLAGMADEAVISEETELLLKAVLRKMPPQRRQVFEMSRDSEMTYNEIAATLGISYNSVLTHIRLAKQDIRSAMTVVLLLLIMRG